MRLPVALACALWLWPSSEAHASLERVGAAIEQGRIEEARRILEGTSSRKGGRAFYLLGRALEAAGTHAEAARAYARAIGALPALAGEIFARQGASFLAAKEPAKAARSFERAIRAAKSLPRGLVQQVLVGVAEAEARRGNCTTASENRRTARQFKRIQRKHWLRMDLTCAQGARCDRAERLGHRAAKELDRRVPARALLAIARCHERAGALALAAAHYDRITAFRFASDSAEPAMTALAMLASRGVRPAPMSFDDTIRAVRLLRAAKRARDARVRLAALRADSTAQERLARFENAELHHAEGDHAAAAKALRALYDQHPRDPGAEGYLRLSARCLREQGETLRAAEALLAADRAAKGPARNGRDLFRAAELFASAGDRARAASAWLRLARREKGHRDAPRAYIRAIETLIEAGQSKEARRVADRFPRAWHRRRIAWRARWLGAWAAFRAGDAKDARRRLERIEKARRAPRFERERARYWRVRVDEGASPARVIARYRAFVEGGPRSIYADCASARRRALRDASAPEPTTLTPEPGVHMPLDEAPPVRRPSRLQASTARLLRVAAQKYARDLPQLPRAAALASVGLFREAAVSLEDAQIEVERARRRPRRRAAFANASNDDAMSDAQRTRRARLRRLDRAAFSLSLAPMLRGLGAQDRAAHLELRFGRTAEGRRARRAARTYPRPYPDLVRLASRAHGVPEELLFAIMMRESAFRTDALSVVGARGLMQIMPKTGRRIAARLGETLARGALDAPAMSLRYGAWYLRELLVKYKGQLPLAIAAYNAGPKAVSRWLDAARAREGALPIAADVFLEEIPYTETRRYVRKVMKSMHTYAHILRGRPSAYVSPVFDPTYGDNIDF